MTTSRRDFLSAAVTLAGASATPVVAHEEPHPHPADHDHSDVPSDIALRVTPWTAVTALPRDDGGPTFSEPWQAQAFALAVRLSEAGYFSWKEWSEVFGSELMAACDRGEPDDGSRYYHHWLAALEK
jgi:nitrile hydratase accessory protein